MTRLSLAALGALWAAHTGQQIVNALPFVAAPKDLLQDRDGIYGNGFKVRIGNLGMNELKIAPRSPRQSSYVERMIGTIRRECLDHMIIFNERQPHRILEQFMAYYHRVRPHKSLADDTSVEFCMLFLAWFPIGPNLTISETI